MRIALKVTVEMTSEQLRDYRKFHATDPDNVREDVRTYIQTALQDSAAFYDGQADVTVRAGS